MDRRIVSFQIAGNLLEQVMAAGDVLALGSIPKSESSSDDLRLLVIIQPPHGLKRTSAEALQRFQAIWSRSEAIDELWCVRTMECRRGKFIFAETLMCVERCSGCLIYLGAIADSGEYEPDPAARVEMELWQSPVALRKQLNSEIVAETIVLTETEFRFSASRPNRTREPINTSPVVAFWQVYLIRLAAARGGACSADLVDKWMPSHADEMHVLRLWPTMRKLGWIAIKQVPMLFHQTVHWEQAPQSMCPDRRKDVIKSPVGAQGLRSVEEADPSPIASNDNSSLCDTSFDDRIAEAVDIALQSEGPSLFL